MFACCQKKSFFIDDILKDISAKNCALRNANHAPVERELAKEISFQEINNRVVDDSDDPRDVTLEEQELSTKVDVEHRRNTCPLYPKVLRVNVGWPAHSGSGGVEGAGKFTESLSYAGNADTRHLFSYFSDPMLNGSPILRNHLAANRYIPHILAMRPGLDYGFDGVSIGWCKPWWGTGARRKGGQVRFSANQTGALERRFGASKYLSPDERRALASTLSLSDRQVKTWFQNRRAKWRRTASYPAEAFSQVQADDESDED